MIEMININSILSRFDGEIKHDKEIFKAVREGEVNPKEEDEAPELTKEMLVTISTAYQNYINSEFENRMGNYNPFTHYMIPSGREVKDEELYVGVDPTVEGNPLADGKAINYIGADPAKFEEQLKKLASKLTKEERQQAGELGKRISDMRSLSVDAASPEPKPVQLTGNKCPGEWIRSDDYAEQLKKTEEIKKKMEQARNKLFRRINPFDKPIHEQFAGVTWAGLTSDAKKDD